MITTRHKRFATWKNQVGLRRSLDLSGAAVEYVAEHQNGHFEQVVRRQLNVLFPAFSDGRPFVIPYEPAWAISTSTEALVCKPPKPGTGTPSSATLSPTN